MQLSSLLSFSLASMMAALLVQPAWCQQQQQQQQQQREQLVSEQQAQQEPENAPEPYSFSYNSESLGGMSSHQESGDGRGHVQGFYTIMGEDGRERRVDYVADENGYRASISTNEVGTRSESSADAQYNAQLPSQGQLEQAKVSAQEYEYLESTHAAERQRHLKQLGANTQQQQQQQQARFSGLQWEQQLDGNSRWSSQGANLARQQADSLNRNQRNWTENADEGWRRARLNVQAQPQPQYSNSGEKLNRSQDEQPSGVSSAPPSLIAGPAESESLSQTGAGQRYAANSAVGGSNLRPQSQSETSNLSGGYEQVVQNQQVPQAAWQASSRGLVPAKRVDPMQRQLEQQFMQQAFQLTEQDYPRQPSAQTDGYAEQQQSRWPQASRTDFQDGRQQQQQQQQQPLRPALNEQRAEQQENVNQLQQQQNNIIDEVSGEQLEPMQPLVSVSQQRPQQVQDLRLNNTASKLPSFAQNLQPQFVAYSTASASTTSTLAPIVYTTTTQAPVTANATTNFQPTPSGLLSISLQNEEKISEGLNQNQGQEVEGGRPVSGLMEAIKQAIVSGQMMEQQMGGFQRTGYNQQPTQDFRPDSIKQVIEKEAQQQQQQQQEEQRDTTTTAPASSIQPETVPARTSLLQPVITRAPEPSTTKQPIQFYEQSTVAPKAPYTQEQQLAGGEFSWQRNQTQEKRPQELGASRRVGQQQQQNVVSRVQGGYFNQRQRGQNSTKAGTKGEEYVRMTSYIQPPVDTGVAYQTQRPLGYQPTRQPAFVAGTQTPAVEQQEFKTASVYSQRQETTTARSPMLVDAGYQRQPTAVRPQQQQQVIETTSGAARPSPVGLDVNSQLQQQLQALRPTGAIKGASAKVAANQRRQFWQPAAAREQVTPAGQAAGDSSASVNYASATAAASFPSGVSFGSRIQAGR